MLSGSSLPGKLMELRDAESAPDPGKQKIKSMKMRISRLMQDGG